MVFTKAWKNRKRIYRKGKKAVGLAYKAYKTAMLVKSLVNVEYKLKDASAQNFTVGQSASNMYRLTDISQGTDYNQRDGLSIKLKSLYIRWGAKINTSADQTQLRCVVFRDMNSDVSTNPTYSDLFETVDNIYTPMNHMNGDRFKVLYDKIISLSKAGTFAQNRKIYKKMYQHVKYSNGTTGRDDGQVYIVWFSDQATNHPTVSYHSRVRFIDN